MTMTGAVARWNTLLHRRFTIRARLALSFGGLAIGCGAVLITLVYLYMRFVPSYDFQQSVPLGEAGGRPAGAVSAPSVAPAILTADDVLDNLLFASVIALVLLAVVGGAVGWLLAGRIIRPLALINEAASRAADGALDHRVAIGGPDDEIRQLSTTFDRMLASLELSFSAHQRFAANASHELRTPLATTKTMIDVVLADPDTDTDDLRTLAERIREVNRTNIETVDALLDLAAADGAPLRHEPIDLGSITRDVARGWAAEAEKAGLTLKVAAADRTPVVAGDPVLAGRAIDNLVRNAVRYNHTGGEVIVRIADDSHGAHVTVINTGPVIDVEKVGSLTEPFVRGSGRARTAVSGHGLGLALVAAVARAHGGSLTISPNPGGGLTAVLTFLRAQSPRRS